MTGYVVASNGAIHVEGCEHARAVKVLNGPHDTIDRARVVASWDDLRVKVAPCARKAARANGSIR